MSAHPKMPIYKVNNELSDAEKSAFAFSNNGKSLTKLMNTKREYLDNVGGKISPTWVFMSIAGIFAAIGFGIYEAFNAQGAISGIIDPMGTGSIPPALLITIGISISIVGMLLGHFIYEGVSEGFTTDQYTGSRNPSSKIWLAVAGVAGAIFYVGYQYSLVKSAGNGNASLAYMPLVVAGIAILELMIGALILNKAFAYIMLFAVTIVMTIISRKMKADARNTNDSYRRYLLYLPIYNKQSTDSQVEKEGNEHIRRAIGFYQGIQEKAVNGATNNIPENPNAEKSTASTSENNTDNNNQETKQKSNSNQENLDSFLNDTIDEDLTA